MLSINEFEKYAAKRGLSGQALTFIEDIRGRPADMSVDGRQRDNSIVYVTSKKMQGRQIKTRSRSLHASAVKWHEFNQSVLEYHTNVHTFDLASCDENGRVRNRQSHTVQLLVLGDEAELEDWREERDLVEAEKRDAERFVKMTRYHLDGGGRWHDRVLEEKCAELGIAYRLRTSRDIPRVFIENMRILDDFHDTRNPLLSSDTEERLREMVDREPVRYVDVLDKEGLSADVLLSAIATGIVYVDLSCIPVRDFEHLMLFRDEGMSKAYTCMSESLLPQESLPLPGIGNLKLGMIVHFNDQQWEIIHERLDDQPEVLFRTKEGRQMVKPRHEALQLVLAQADQNERRDILDAEKRRSLGNLTSDALKKAAAKYSAIRDGTAKLSKSTLWRAKQAIQKSASITDAILALAPRDADKGSRIPRLPPAVEALAKEFIEKEYNAPNASSAQQIFNKYSLACAERGLCPMSYVTFLVRVKEHRSIRDRHGKRVAYRDSDIPLILDIREPIHGLFPHEVVYIDHTQPNLMTAGTHGEDWGKVWLSAAVDAHVPIPRASYVSYDPPSAWSALMVLRDYVRRWHRLPRVVVVDGGKEFRSHAFQLFCKIFGIEIRYRGPGRPRGGALVERMFGVTEQEFFTGLEGSSLQLKDARMTTKSVSPNQFRKWTFPALCRALDHYLFQVRPLDVHPRLGISPREFEEARIQQTGLRKHMSIEFDENLLLLTCPAPPQSQHRVYPHRGIWESGRYYWHSSFSTLGKRKLEVRIEPWLAQIIYVYTGSRWEVATARDVEPLRGRTRYELNQAIREKERFARLQAARERRKPERTARLVESREPLNFDETIAAKQRVMSDYYRSLGLSVAKYEAMPLLDAPYDQRRPSTDHSSTESQENMAIESGAANRVAPKVACETLDVPQYIGDIDDETAML
ncbi:transposase family protein [Paraburkholderia sp. J76]|uniref:integrase catalytic domain-containing protein n=1 Tax=Paraburkholderia sp. J76 TaxID=2805439 RepID=UPI002ABE8838|nr:transposase family protein [Paraburkholderia sp. J76]